jgi:hypothetical protein
MTNAEFKQYVDTERHTDGRITYRVAERKIVLHPASGAQPATMYEQVQFNRWVKVTRRELVEIVEDVRHQAQMEYMDEQEHGYGLAGL